LCMGLLIKFPGQQPALVNGAPSVQLHYEAFCPTTDASAPVPRFGTLALVVSST
jgi:hypothetical protein